jgi:hypothetical protein
LKIERRRVGADSRAAHAAGYYQVVNFVAEVLSRMKLRSLIVALAFVACAAVGARAQGDGQNLPRITLDEFKEKLARGEIVVIDVRSAEVAVKIKGAAHIPEADLQARLTELPRDREIVTYCA